MLQSPICSYSPYPASLPPFNSSSTEMDHDMEDPAPDQMEDDLEQQPSGPPPEQMEDPALAQRQQQSAGPARGQQQQQQQQQQSAMAPPGCQDPESALMKINFLEFLQKYVDVGAEPEDPAAAARPHYATKIPSMRDTMDTTLMVNFEHLREHDLMVGNPADQGLAHTIQENFYRVEPGLKQAVQNFVQLYDPAYCKEEDGTDKEFFIRFFNVHNFCKLRMLKVSPGPRCARRQAGQAGPPLGAGWPWSWCWRATWHRGHHACLYHRIEVADDDVHASSVVGGAKSSRD